MEEADPAFTLVGVQPLRRSGRCRRHGRQQTEADQALGRRGGTLGAEEIEKRRRHPRSVGKVGENRV
jgi:hypothetical protein